MNREAKICAIPVRIAQGYTDKEIMYDLDIPKRTFYRWKNRIEKEGHASVARKKKPGPAPQFCMDAVNARRIQIWRKTYGWGPTKIEGHLYAHYGIHIPHNRIRQLFVDKGLNKPIGELRKTWGRKRWERQHSMTLWQGDWKDINADDEKPMMTFYDDHSRFVAASKRFDEAIMENAIKLAGFAFKRYGLPEQILTDNGSQFKNNHGDALTAFEQFCIDSGVQVIHSTKNRPTTLGKLENFIGCYDRGVWITHGNHDRYMTYWNNKRPNGAVGYLYPREVFYRDRKGAINSG